MTSQPEGPRRHQSGTTRGPRRRQRWGNKAREPAVAPYPYQWTPMKITNIETFPVFNGTRNNLFVTVDTDEGMDGVGESGLSGRELAVIGAIEHFKPLLIGQDATRIEHLWQVLFRGGFFPAHRVIASAISAIDVAPWDIPG